MLDLVARKTDSGDICVNLARQHLRKHEWGLARMALEQGLAKGQLTEPETAYGLFDEICARLGHSIDAV